MTELIDMVYNPPMEKSRIAAFAPEVERIALEGDPIAMQILDDEVEWLGKLALSIVSKCGTTEIGLYGSMLVKVRLSGTG
jgi:N-acetylglucosamine kinase-like BadF-type ATPase